MAKYFDVMEGRSLLRWILVRHFIRDHRNQHKGGESTRQHYIVGFGLHGSRLVVLSDDNGSAGHG
jgi:hypothetical protein